MSRCHAPALALAVTCGVLAIAGCGSSSTPPTTVGSGPLTAAVKFAACMRSHGVSSFRDPTPNGQGSSAGPAVKRSPAFHAAQQACHAIQAELVDMKPKPSRARQLAQAECMRAHGVTGYPDPLPGGGFSISSSVDPQSPTFIAASKACGRH